MVLSLDCNSLFDSGIAFAHIDNEIVLLMKIDYSLLNDHEIHKLRKNNAIECVDDNYYINFGQFNNGTELLKNIKNFLSNFYIDNNNYNFIKLVPKNYYLGVNRKLHNIKNNTRCVGCGKKIVRDFYLGNKRYIGFIGNNPNRCAYCFSRILISYFIDQVRGLTGSKAYIKSISSNPDLIDFYFNLLESTGIISRHSFLFFQRDIQPVKKGLYSEIPKIYLIKDNLKENFLMNRSRICGAIDANTLSSSNWFSHSYQDKLKKHHLSIHDGWKIREELISYVNDGSIKRSQKKYINKLINRTILDYSKRKKFQQNQNKKKPKKHNKNKQNKKKPEIQIQNNKKRIFIRSNELRRLIINPNGGLRNSFINLLNQENLSVENGIEIVSILTENLNQKKLNEEDVENKLYQLIKEYPTKLEKDKVLL